MTKNQAEQTSSSSQDTYRVEKRIDLLFSKFAAFYGHLWRSQFKDEAFLKFAKKEWQEALLKVSDAILTKAILDCLELHELPPTLPQVRQLCKRMKEEAFLHPSWTHTRPEVQVSTNKAMAEAYIQEWKKILAK